jgi:hypothetical protein
VSSVSDNRGANFKNYTAFGCSDINDTGLDNGIIFTQILLACASGIAERGKFKKP